MEKVRKDAAEFLASVKRAHSNDYKMKLIEWENTLQEERANRLQERADKRAKERRNKWLLVCPFCD